MPALFDDVAEAKSALPAGLFDDIPEAKSSLPTNLFEDVPDAPKPKDEMGVGEEVRGIGRSVVRGGRRFVQMMDVNTLRREEDLTKQLDEARKKLPAYERTGLAGAQRERIAMLEGELANFRNLPADTKEKAAKSLAAQEQKIETLPLTAAQAEFQDPKTPWWKFFSNPVELSLTTTAESLPTMALGLSGAALGPAGLATTMGASSFSSESSARVLGAMQKDKVDLQNPDAVLGWFKDRAKSAPALAKADLAALGPASFDALTAGVAGRWLRGASGQGARAVAGATAKEIGFQMAGGGAGSIVGSALAGEKIDWKDVVLEMAAEIAPVEAISNVRSERAAQVRLAEANNLPATAEVLKAEPVPDGTPGSPLAEPIELSISEEAKTVEAPKAPVPETADAISKQLDVTLDPASTKAVTLVTPGSKVPTAAIESGLEMVQTKHGLALYNPAKTTEEAVLAAAEGKDFDGTLLGMSQASKPEPVGNTVVQTVKDGVPVIDEVVAPTPEAIAAATEAHKAAVPGGETVVKPAEKVLKERAEKKSFRQLMDEQEAAERAREADRTAIGEIGELPGYTPAIQLEDGTVVKSKTRAEGHGELQALYPERKVTRGFVNNSTGKFLNTLEVARERMPAESNASTPPQPAAENATAGTLPDATGDAAGQPAAVVPEVGVAPTTAEVTETPGAQPEAGRVAGSAELLKTAPQPREVKGGTTKWRVNVNTAKSKNVVKTVEAATAEEAESKAATLKGVKAVQEGTARPLEAPKKQQTKEQKNEDATKTRSEDSTAANRVDRPDTAAQTTPGPRAPDDAAGKAAAPAPGGNAEVKSAGEKLGAVVNEAVDRAASKTKLGISPLGSARPADVVLGAADLQSVSPTVEARWRAAVKGTEGLLEKLRVGVANAWASITREYAGLPPRDFPREIDILRRLRASRNASARTTVDVLKGITHDLGPKQYSVFNRVVLLEDLAKDVESGKYADGRDLPFGYANAEELQADLSKFEAIAEATPEIRTALERRREFMETLTATLVESGFLPESVLEDGRYFHHQVLLYMAEKKATGAPRDFRDWFSGWQRARRGSSLDYNRQYVESEAEVIADALNKISMQQLQGEMKKVADLTPSLKALHGKDWAEHIPDTHVKWQPKEGNVFYPVQTVAERVMEQYLAGLRAIMPEDFREALAIGRKRPEWVIPQPLARVLDNLAPREQTWIDRLASAGISGWKKYILLNPLRAIKYNLNNLSGDLDFLMAAQPRIFGEYKNAAQDMWGFHVRGKSATGDVAEAMEAGVIGSGWRASELPNIAKSDYFYWLTGDRPKLVDRYWNWITKRNDAREDAGRLAAYRFAVKEWAAGRPFYGASVPEDVNTLGTPKLKAAKVAREILIDYGRETEFGEFMRRKFIPFYRWMHGNAARYLQLMANVRTAEGEGAAATRGAALAGKAVAGKSVSLGLRMVVAYALVNIWNHLFFPDEEDELGEGRNQLHLILGRDAQGNIQTIRFQGALSDLLGWFGGENLPQDVEDIAKGHASVGDKMEDAYEAAISRVVNASQPFAKTLAEAGLGRSFYPNALEPRPIRDKAEHIAGLFSLASVYQWLAGKPHKPFTREVANLVSYTTDPGEAAYNATRHLASEWLEDMGEERANVIPGKRSNALYYHKQALRYKDADMAAKWLKEYEALGGKREGLRTSIEKSEPLAMLGKKRGQFMQSLSPEQRATVDRAEKWFRKVYRP